MTEQTIAAPADVAARHEAIGPFTVQAEGGRWTAGYSIRCTCGWQSGELHLLDSRHPELPTPQVAAIKDHWKHLLDVSMTKESA